MIVDLSLYRKQYCRSVQLYLECDAAKRAPTAFAIAPLIDQQAIIGKLRKLHCLVTVILRCSNRLQHLPHSAVAVQPINEAMHCKALSSKHGFQARDLAATKLRFNMWS